MSDGILRIAEYEFKVEKALLHAYVCPDDFYWKLKIYTEEKELFGLIVAPFVYSERIPGMSRIKLQRWTDILGRQITWKESYDPETEITHANLCVWSHEDINESTLEFYKNNEELWLSWDGETDVGAGEFDEYDVIAFFVRTPVTFEGFSTRGIPEALALKELQLWVTDEEFELPQHDDDDTFLFRVIERLHKC